MKPKKLGQQVTIILAIFLSFCIQASAIGRGIGRGSFIDFILFSGVLDDGLAFDEQQGGAGLVGETVRIFTGNAVEHRRDLRFSSPHRLGLSFAATYNSRAATSGTLDSLGLGWRHTHSVSLLYYKDMFLGLSYIRIVDETGRVAYFMRKAARKAADVYGGLYQERSYVVAESSGYVWYRLDGSKYGFSDAGKLLWIDDEKGNRLSHSYDTYGRLKSVFDNASGRELTFHYSETSGLLEHISGLITAQVPDGIWVRYGYEGQNLTSVRYADDSGYLYSYTDSLESPLLKDKKDMAGHLLAGWSYDIKGRCEEHFSVDGNSISIEYENETRVNVTDAYGVLRTYTIGEIGSRKRVKAMQGPAGPPYSDGNAVRWEYDGEMNLTEVEYANGTIHKYQNYDARGNPGTIILAAGEAEERTMTYSYHPAMNVPLSRTEASVLGDGSKVTIWDYDADGDDQPNENPSGLLYRLVEQGFTTKQVSSISLLPGLHEKTIFQQDAALPSTEYYISPYTYVTTFSYNNKGQVEYIDRPLPGNDDVTEFIYDPLTGNLNGITQPLIGSTVFPESDYDAAGLAGKMVDVNGNSTRFEYDGRGRVTKVIHDADKSFKNAIYVDGFLDTSIDEDGVESGYEYDAEFGRLYRIYDPEDNYIQYKYDDQGNLTEKSTYAPSVPTDQRFSYKRWDYNGPDIPGKLWKELNFNDSYTEYRYHPNGNLKSKTDAENRTSMYEYGALNRLKKVIQNHAASGDTVTSYDYDKHGNLNSVTDAEGHVTTYSYDDMGRLISATSPDTGKTSYFYDEAGNLTHKIDANFITTVYSYDILNRLTTIRFLNDSNEITYSYDERINGIGQRTGMTDPSGSTTFDYDKRGRLVKKVSFIGGIDYELARELSYGNRLTLLTYPVSIHKRGSSTTQGPRETRYIRQPNTGKIVKITTIRNSRKFTLLSDISYNPFSGPMRLTTGSGGNVYNQSSDCGCIEVSNPGSPMEQVFTYYDDRNLKSIRGTYTPWFDQDFSYDSLGRLENATGAYGSFDFSYDKDGNRLTCLENEQLETYSYYPGTNRLEAVMGKNLVNYTYDDNGNLTIIGNRTYIYNQNNRLVRAEEAGNVIAEYTYNGLGQRVIKKVGDNTTIFLYGFIGKIIGESKPDRFITTEYIYAGSNPIVMADVESREIYYYLNNYLGTPVLMTDKKGKVVWEAEYKPFGEVEISPQSNVKNNFRFAGQYFDEETGLHYNYFRYYDPATGRYLTPDPIGLIGGINLYTYTHNNPINAVDPRGLFIGQLGLEAFMVRLCS
jgi:RHS repeat-associated protein